VRLTCTGQLFQCLGQEKETDLRKSLRDNPGNDAPVVDAIHAAIALKPKGHDFSYDRKEVAGEMTRHMSHTGG
jgi:cyclic pyranopterin phosphate synthase